MAKSSRASSVKANNRALKKNVFGPVEDARTARLSAKLLELAAQPKPQRDEKMDEDAGEAKDESKEDEPTKMDDSASKKAGGKRKIEKRRVKKKSSILFHNKFADKKKKRR
ncbi:hypothetical protein GQ53DRAFT_642268 [Thozetella sp. PMI_491]|nr:hypothetical protein GQ53DRAFT_642268 [Thozetella sp. PMI_491]